jgi:hypothetical protein
MRTRYFLILVLLPVFAATNTQAQTQLAAPRLLAPVDQATAVRINTLFVWSSSVGATTYELQVSTDSAFSGSPVKRSGIVDTNYQMTGLSHKTIYYWRVMASDAGRTSPFSVTNSFRSHVTPGDFGGSGEMQSAYAAIILRHVAGVSMLSGDALEIAEVTGDRTVSAYDAALVLQCAAGLLSVFPVDQ